MGQSVYPPTSGSIIKSIQRGTASSSGTVTITSVNTSKTTVTSVSNESTGTVGISGNADFVLGAMNGGTNSNYGRGNGGTVGISVSHSGGTNTLVSAVAGAYLTDSTTLTVTGACLWQVVEYA